LWFLPLGKQTHYPPTVGQETNLTRSQLKTIQDLPSLNRDQLEMLSDERKPRRTFETSNLMATTSAPSVLLNEERPLLPPSKLVIDI
jgi:hypothetical protein